MPGMVMTGLPTYEEAVSGGDWLDLVAPYVALCDYARLCRVSHRFYRQFAPRLWNDPLQSMRRLGHTDTDSLDWYVRFVTQQAPAARRATRQLVASLDFDGLRLDCIPWFPLPPESSPETLLHAESFSLSLRLLPKLFPAVRCIVFDGLTTYNVECLVDDPMATPNPADGSHPGPLLLSLAGCRLPMPHAFFDKPQWRLLRYLDLSHVPESLRPLLRAGGRDGLDGPRLPNLIVLKLRGRHISDTVLYPLAAFLNARQPPLWSLDLSENKLSDTAVSKLRPCFGRAAATAAVAVAAPRPAHERHVSCPSLFDVEGRLAAVTADAASTVTAPELAYIVESPWSAAYSHPARYLADAPGYDLDRPYRLAGNEPLRSDNLEDLQRTWAGGAGHHAPDWHGLLQGGDTTVGPGGRPSLRGLTHLHLSENPDFTVHGIDLLFCAGHARILEHFDCAAPAFPRLPRLPYGVNAPGPPAFALTGVLGRSYLFRPVVATNLRSLRIHHSLVTHIPSVAASQQTTSTLADDCYAETVLRARADRAFPGQALVPDLNPRLESLTLTGLPRRSTGPLRDRLLRFLLQAFEQQEAIRLARGSAAAASAVHRRGPAMLRGLRHIRLEFRPPVHEPAAGDDGFANLDAAALLHDDTQDAFSFFAGETWSVAAAPSVAETKNPVKQTQNVAGPELGPSTREQQQRKKAASNLPARLLHYPLPGAGRGRRDSDNGDGVPLVDAEHVRDTVSVWDPIRAQAISVAVTVWVGTGILSSSAGQPGPATAVDAYMQNLAHLPLRTRIQPATPGQVQAGVPAGSCVYNAAWDAMLRIGLDDDDASAQYSPTSAPALPMHDVVEAIRVFREETRAAYAAYRRGRGPENKASDGGGGNDEDRTGDQATSPWTIPSHRHWTGSLELVLPKW